MSQAIRHVPKAERAEKNGAQVGVCDKVQLIDEVDRLTREVHTVTHQLSTITKRLFDLKERINRAP